MDNDAPDGWDATILYTRPLDGEHMITVERVFGDQAKRYSCWGITIRRQGELAGDPAIAAEAIVANDGAPIAIELLRCVMHATVMLRYEPRKPS